ncbi:MAG: hypothetical protein H6653_13715 [Ardenticatenaceae bacterium]|nr:hypothetical protein [Ardenticatenaceae bacterium]
MTDKIMLVPTEREVYNQITDASRFEYFSVSGPGLIRLIQPFIKERLFSKRSDVFIMRVSLLLPWSSSIREMTHKERFVSNPTRRAPISDEVISNFGEFLELGTLLENCTSKFIFTFECYDCPPFFKYAFVETENGKTMCLKNYMTFVKGMSTIGREISDAFDIGKQHYDDAQRVLQEFGLKVAEITNLYGKVKTTSYFHLLNEMSQTKHYRIESGSVNEYDLQLLQTGSANLATKYNVTENISPELDKIILLSTLNERLSDDEIRTICFSLDIEYDNLPGEGKIGKLRELIMQLERRRQVSKLKTVILQLRPDIEFKKS